MSNSKRKAAQHAAIRERAADALRDLYHNATPQWPELPTDELATRFFAWLADTAASEIDYIRDGGAYGKDYNKTLEHPCYSGQYKSEKARRYYVRMKLLAKDEEQARCNKLDSRKHATNAFWERIGEYGKLYQYGRGGRTLAPDELVETLGGSSFRIREEYADELPLAEAVRLIQTVESFNRYCADWCNSVPTMWAEMLRQERADRLGA
jgi:hypothetical protein